MLRALLLGILAVSGMASCKGGADAPSVQPGVAAGKVMELEGEVTATRAGTTRTLTKGADVSGDDEIATGATGYVSIVLGHNNARWELNANKRVKVGDSDAWTMAKQTAPSATVDELTTAAGRHAEKQAATTGATSDQQAAHAPAAAVEGAPAASSDQATPPPPPAPRPAATVPKVDRKREVAKSAAKDDALVPRDEPARTTVRRAPALGLEKGTAPGGGAPSVDAPSPMQPPSDEGELTTIRAAMTTALRTHRAAIATCLEGEAPTAEVALVAVLGKGAFEVKGANDAAKVSTCLKPIAAKLTFEMSKTPVRIKVTR